MRTKLEAPTVLKTIFDRKIQEVVARQQHRSLAELEQARADAMQSLLHLTMQRHSLLCEPLDRLSVLGRALLQL